MISGTNNYNSSNEINGNAGKGLAKIEEAILKITDFTWLETCQEKDINDIKPCPKRNNQSVQSKEEIKKMPQEKNKIKENEVLMLPMCYEEYKITKCPLMDRDPLLASFLKPRLTTFAYERCKYEICQAIKYWKIETDY